ncbi:MAG: hypothetical protein RJA24_261 [Pseudomonadota bacterium]
MIYAPGGITDFAARVIGPRLGELLGSAVLIVIQSDAGSILGSEVEGLRVVHHADGGHYVRYSAGDLRQVAIQCAEEYCCDQPGDGWI